MKKSKSIVSNVRYGHCRVDAVSGEIVWSDDGLRDFAGYTRQDLKESKLKISELLLPWEKDEVYNMVKTQCQKKGTASVCHRIVCKDNSLIPVFCYIEYDSENNVYDLLIQMIERYQIPNNFQPEERDPLTNLYNREFVETVINKQIKENPDKEKNLAVFDMKNIYRFMERYGDSFVDAMIYNGSTYINSIFRKYSAVVGRINTDIFVVFFMGDEESAKERTRAALWELQNAYHGEDRRMRAGGFAGIYHFTDSNVDYEQALYRATCAMYMARRVPDNLSVYTKEIEDAVNSPDFGAGQVNFIESYENKYDKEFVAFAVELLANVKDIDSTLNLLLQRIGWHYNLEAVTINMFTEDGLECSNRWRKGVGIMPPTYNADLRRERSSFLTRFDKHGCMSVNDIDVVLNDPKAYYAKSFKKAGIRSFASCLMMDDLSTLGFITYATYKNTRDWNSYDISTLNQITKIISAFVSLRHERKKEHDKLDMLAYDMLTGLYTYQKFLEEAKLMLDNRDSKLTYAMIYSDLDNFSYINENFGFEAGDRILKDFAMRLTKQCIGCRVRADRFVIMSFGRNREEIQERVKRINTEFIDYQRSMYETSDLGISTGIYFIPKDTNDVVLAVDNANAVRKASKGDKFLEFGVYTDKFKEEREHEREIVGSVHSAIEAGHIEAFLQPKFSMKTMKVVGAEALVRWRNDDGTYKYPDQFIPILEEVGYIVDLDFCVYRQVLERLVRWKEDGQKIIPISVNFSRVHTQYMNFVDRVTTMAKLYGIDPKWIELEFTESTVSKNDQEMLDCMVKLRENGFKIDIDDFGTGYSSLNMLVDTPADIVKVDKSFIDNYKDDTQKAYINQIGNLILTANKEVIFEGVETPEQIKILTGYGYDNAQGYVFSRPVPMKEFEEKYIYKK